jgi:hypothetical protein
MDTPSGNFITKLVVFTAIAVIILAAVVFGVIRIFYDNGLGYEIG